MPRSSGTVCSLVLTLLTALGPGESMPTVDLARAISREGGDVRAALRDLRARSLVETVDEGTKRARHRLVPGTPRVVSPLDPGNPRVVPASREVPLRSKSGSLNGNERSEAAAAAGGEASPLPRMEEPPAWLWKVFAVAEAVADRLMAAVERLLDRLEGCVSAHKPEAGTPDAGIVHRDVKPEDVAPPATPPEPSALLYELTPENLAREEKAWQARLTEARDVEKKPIRTPHKVRPSFIWDCRQVAGHLETYLAMHEEQHGFSFAGTRRAAREAAEAETLARLRAEDRVRFEELRALGVTR